MNPPPPDLQSLVQQFGGYDRITSEAWEQYDRDLAQWRNRVASGEATNAEKENRYSIRRPRY